MNGDPSSTFSVPFADLRKACDSLALDPPSDWCYVNNFADPERPCTLCFPAGRGTEYRDDMQELIEEMRLAIPAAFDDDDYRNQLKALEETTQKEVREQWQSLDEQASRNEIAVLQTPTGVVLAPVRDGEVLSDQEFDELPKGKRKKIQAAMHQLSEELQARIESAFSSRN
jgi:hypothetical protein